MHVHYLEFTTWLRHHPEWGGVAAFVVAFAESIAILGTIIPGSITMTAIGILIGSGVLDIYSTVMLAALGAVIGDILSYFCGYFFKNNIKNTWPFCSHPQWLDHAADFFDKHGGKSVFIGRFIGPIRAMIPIIAGMLSMRPFRFLAFDVVAAILWAPVYLFPGYVIGLASTTLPAAVATRLILTLFGILILFWLIFWFLQKTSAYLSRQLDRMLNGVWNWMKRRPHWRWVCRALHDANHPNDHGQLLLCLLATVSIVFFLVLFINTFFSLPFQSVDMFIYHFFRGFRFTNIDYFFVILNSVGGKFTLYLSTVLIFFTLLFSRRYSAAWHWLFLCMASACIAVFFQQIHYVHRPTGIALIISTSSFPSVQITATCSFYGFLAWLICLEKPQWKKIVYSLAAACLLLAILARLYLGYHWFSDIVASFLLAMACSTIAAISYQRKLSTPPRSSLLLTLAIISIFLSIFTDIGMNAKQLLLDSTPIWLKEELYTNEWWDKRTPIIPSYRTTRFGYPAELLNIQWAGNLPQIEKELQLGGWRTVHRNLTSVLLTQLQHAKHSSVNIMPTLYHDQRPALEMIKEVPELRKILLIRLWPANVLLQPQDYPLWIGTFNYLHPYDRRSWIAHTYLLIPEEEALPVLISSLRIDDWRVMIRPASNIPVKLLPSPDAPHYTILIKPK